MIILGKSSIADHLLFDVDESCLHRAAIWIPRVDGHSTSALVDARKIDPGDEFDCWWSIWIIWTTDNLEEVDSSVEVATLANDGSVPVGECLVVWIIKTVRARWVRNLSLLSFLELIKKLECSWL